MTDKPSSNRSFSSLVRRAAESLLALLVNPHTKRVILLSSLWSRVSRTEKLHSSAIHRLNQLMAIASDERSLVFSSRFENLIWGTEPSDFAISPEVLSSGVLSSIDRWHLAEQLVENSPKCLRYDTRTGMINDFYQLLGSYMDSLRTPTTA